MSLVIGMTYILYQGKRDNSSEVASVYMLQKRILQRVWHMGCSAQLTQLANLQTDGKQMNIELSSALHLQTALHTGFPQSPVQSSTVQCSGATWMSRELTNISVSSRFLQFQIMKHNYRLHGNASQHTHHGCQSVSSWQHQPDVERCTQPEIQTLRNPYFHCNARNLDKIC